MMNNTTTTTPATETHWTDGRWSCTTCDQGFSYNPSFTTELDSTRALAILIVRDPHEGASVVVFTFTADSGDDEDRVDIRVNGPQFVRSWTQAVRAACRMHSVEAPSEQSISRAALVGA